LLGGRVGVREAGKKRGEITAVEREKGGVQISDIHEKGRMRPGGIIGGGQKGKIFCSPARGGKNEGGERNADCLRYFRGRGNFRINA